MEVFTKIPGWLASHPGKAGLVVIGAVLVLGGVYLATLMLAMYRQARRDERDAERRWRS